MLVIGQETVLSPYVSHLTSLPLTLPTSLLSSSLALLNLELRKLLGTFLSEGDADLLLLVVVKVAGVAWSFELGDEGSFHLRTRLKAADLRSELHRRRSQRIYTVYTAQTIMVPFSGRWQSSQWLQTICVP